MNQFLVEMRRALHRRAVRALIAVALLEYETLDGSQIRDIIEHGEMKTPPRSPKPPELPQESPPASPKKAEEEDIEDDDGPLPEAVGAPA